MQKEGPCVQGGARVSPKSQHTPPEARRVAVTGVRKETFETKVATSLLPCWTLFPTSTLEAKHEPFIHTGATSSITWIGELGRGQPQPPVVHAESPKEDAFQQKRADLHYSPWAPALPAYSLPSESPGKPSGFTVGIKLTTHSNLALHSLAIGS